MPGMFVPAYLPWSVPGVLGAPDPSRAARISSVKQDVWECQRSQDDVISRLNEARTSVDAAVASADTEASDLWMWRAGTLEVLHAALMDLCASASDLLGALERGTDQDVAAADDRYGRGAIRADQAKQDVDKAFASTIAPPKASSGPSVGKVALVGVGLLAVVGIAWAMLGPGNRQ